MEQPDPAAVGYWQFTGTKAQISGISYPKLTLHRAGNTSILRPTVAGFQAGLHLLLSIQQCRRRSAR